MKKLVLGVFVLCMMIHIALGQANSTTILTEDWESGIDTTKWKIWGSPSPVLDSSSDAIGTYSFQPNGDANWDSGVVSLDSFLVTPGLEVSFSSIRRRIVTFYNFNAVSLTTSDLSAFGSFTAKTEGRLGPAILHSGETGTGLGTVYWDQDGRKIISDSSIGNWVDLMFRFNSDGSVSYFQDGVNFANSSAGWINYSTAPEVRLVLGGRGNGLMDNIQVTPTPEPATMLLLGTGLVGVAGAARRRKKN